MTRCTLEATYPRGRPLVGPLVTVSLTDSSAHRLHLHPALYRGVQTERGGLGTRWWAFPVEALRLPANGPTGRLHILLPVLGQQWRIKLGRGEPLEARLEVARLASYLGVRGRGRRGSDGRIEKTLRRTLDAAQDCGVIGRWWVERGSLGRVSGALYATPGPLSVDVVRSQRVPKPAWIPATGAELDQWMHSRNRSTGAIAGQLGISARTIRRARALGARPLPLRTRTALRKLLWRTKVGGCLPTSGQTQGGACPIGTPQATVLIDEMPPRPSLID